MTAETRQEQASGTQGAAPAENRDGLLECLVFLTARYGQSRSPDALKAGLPIKPGGRMTPEIFCKAAERAGFKVQISQRPPEGIPETVLPAVLTFKDGRACVLLGYSKDGRFKLHWPASGEERLEKPEVLHESYSGYAIFARPAKAAKDEGNKEAGITDYRHHWFWSTVIDSKDIYTRALISTVLINLFALTGPLFIMNVYNRVLPNQAIETGWVLGIGAISIFVFDFIIKTLRGYFIDIAARKADVILGQRLYDQVLDARLGALQKRPVGVMANALREFDAIREFFTSATMTGLVDFPFSMLFLFVVFLISAPIAASLVFFYVAVMAIGFLFQLPVKNAVARATGSNEARHGLLIETLSAIEMIRGIGGEGKLRALYAEYTGKSAEQGQASRFYSGLGVNISGFFQQVSGAVAVLIGMYLVKDGDLTAGALIAAVILSGRAIAPLGQVAALINKFYHARGAFHSLDQIMAMPLERAADQTFLHRPHIKGSFHFKDVSFSYTKAGSGVMALDHVSFAIAPGEKVGIVGRIGSGKSTIIKLMLHFYEATEGSILVDATDIRQIDPADLRRNISYFGQDTILFTGTVRENITLGKPEATDAEVFKAAELAGVHEFIRRHPLGYDAPVGERGAGFSGGQRQAIALARTLLTNAPVLVCDEPTNSMDAMAEEMLISKLQAYNKDKTFVLVTHKPSMLRLVDRLIMVDQGKIIADGPRDAVLEALGAGKIAVRAG